MERVVVSDTNIFIDLIKLDLLDSFFALPLDAHTTAFVLAELKSPGMKEKVQKYIENKKLTIKSFDSSQVSELYDFISEHSYRLSVTDCSVFYYAKEGHYSILTGDKALRTSAEADGIETHGILYVFESLVKNGILENSYAAQRLEVLKTINKRLPSEELDSLINKLRQQD